MPVRPPRDEREWRALVERQLREVRSGIRPLIDSAVTDLTEVIDGAVEQGSSRHPTAPIELTYQTALYLDSEGRLRVRFMLDFPDVTKATDATDIEIAQYELWGKPVSAPLLLLTTDSVPGLAVPGLTMPGLAATPSNVEISEQVRPWQLLSTNTESFFRADGFLPNHLWHFRARAIGLNLVIPGNWSIELTVQMAEDETAPSQPTPPILTVERGTITATWDGQSVSGAMPADFKYCILAHGTDSSPTHEIARFGRGGGFKVVANFPYYDPQFFRLQAFDESGNASPWSEQAVGYTTPLVDKDIILSTIDAAVTHLKNVDAGVSILPNTVITEHLVVTEEMTAAIANFLHVRADMLETNEIWADEAWFGVADAMLVRSDMFEGRSFTGGTFTGALFQTDVEALTGIKFDSSGVLAWNSGGEQTLEFNAATGEIEILGTFQVGSTAEPHLLLAKNVWSIWPGIRFKVQDPDLDYQPTMFALGETASGWSVGDLVLLGGELDANTSPRGQLTIRNRGGEIGLEREWGGAFNGVFIGSDNGTRLQGHLDTDNSYTTFMRVSSGQVQFASGSFTWTVSPPPYGMYMPVPVPDGIGPLSFNTRNVTASGFEVHFSGPANNSTSFSVLLYWKP
jgi:hypothetical protein